MVIFTAKHHAILFGYISRQVFQRVSEDKAESALKKAVNRYGEERGARMARRARSDRRELSMLNYMIYGEWTAAKGEMFQERLLLSPDLHMRVKRCPWAEAWKEKGVTGTARIYCQVVDGALIRGFNPALKIDMDSTQTNEGIPCDFVYRGANLDHKGQLKYWYGKNIYPAKRAVRGWDYHTAHLYHTINDVLENELGTEGKAAVDAAVFEFQQEFGEEAMKMIVNIASREKF